MFAKRRGQAVIYGIMIVFVAVVLLAGIAPMLQDQIDTTSSALTGLPAEAVKLILAFMIVFFIVLPLLIVVGGQ